MHEPPRQLCGRAGTDLPGRAARAGAWTLARVRPALSQAARRARGGGRYIPAAGDAVVGTVAERHADSYTVELGAPFPGTLPALGFEGATRRNRPTLAPGDLVYARVAAASRDAGHVRAQSVSDGHMRLAQCSKKSRAARRPTLPPQYQCLVGECSAECPATRMQAAGFGPLQEGVVVTCSSALVRQLLASPPPPVRAPPWA